jgi:hypothetical protein
MTATHAMLQFLAHHVLTDHVLADPTPVPSPTPAPKGVNTDGILGFIFTKITPIILGLLGLLFVARANKGEVGKVLTSSTIALIGLGFMAGATTLFFAGDYFVKLIFG